MAVSKGAVNMTRYAALLAVSTILIIIVHALMLYQSLNSENLLPILTLSLKNYLLGTHLVTMLPFCDTVIFFMFCPFLSKPDDFGKGMVKGLLIGGTTLFFVVLRDIMVNGTYLQLTSLPTFSTIRLIDVGDILTRLEIVYAITLITLYFFKVSTVYYAVVSGLSRTLKFKPYHALILITGVIVVVYSDTVFQSPFEHIKWKMTTAATYSTFFILVLPLLTLIVSSIRDFFSNNKRLNVVQTNN